MKRIIPAVLLLVAGQLVAGQKVSAETIGLFDPTNSPTGFNAFVFNNANLSSGGGDAENAVAVRNTLSVNTYNFAINSTGSLQNAPTTLDKVAAYVGGALNISGTASFKGNVYAGSTNQNVTQQNPHVNLNGGSFYAGSQYVSDSVFTNESDYATSLSASLKRSAPTLSNGANYSSNVTLPGYQQNQPINNISIDASQFTTTKNGNTISFVTLDGAFLSSFNNAPTIGVTGLADGATLVINVVGNLTSNNFQFNAPSYSHVIWNFSNATEIDVNKRVFEGSILAPNATVNQSLGNIEGTLIAQNWNQSNAQEIHQNYEFTGNFSPVYSNLTIPEPAFYQMGVFLSCGGLLAIRLRRRKSD